MPRAFLVKKSSIPTLGNSRSHHGGRKPSTSDSQKDVELPWEPLDMSEYENGLQTAQTVERELDSHVYRNARVVPPEARVVPPEDGRKRENPALFKAKTLSVSESRPRLPLFLSPSLKSEGNELGMHSFSDEDVEKPFECRHCIISFSRLHELQRHMEIHESKKPLNCEPPRSSYNGSVFESQLNDSHSIKSLLRPNTGDLHHRKPFKCEEKAIHKIPANEEHFFEKPFESTRILFPRSNAQLQYSIPCSDKTFLECEERKTRTKTDTNNKDAPTAKPFKCQECGKSFTLMNDLQCHYDTHSNRKSTSSEEVDVTSDRESVTSEESQTEKPFKCSHCVMSFTRPSDLQRHLLIHSSNKPYRCDKCDREFTWFGNFQKHILSHMSDNSQSSGSYSAMFTLLAREQVKDLFIKEGDKYRCRLCSKDFTRLSGLKTHIRMHTGERPYVCEVCSFAFTTSRALKMHTRLHTGEKPYKCDVCDRAFTRRDEMHTHMYIHKGEKPFKCTECSASFIRYGHLQRHLLIHSEDKPYKCKLCPKSFTQYRNLQTHTYKHTGERPYRCKYCPKGFTQYGTLQAHERTHTGEKPFKCQLCEKAFITSSHLRWHIKTQHPKKQSD